MNFEGEAKLNTYGWVNHPEDHKYNLDDLHTHSHSYI